MARRKKEFVISKDDLCYEEPMDEICFTDYVPPSKDAVASFCFSDEATEENLSFDNRKEEAKPFTETKFTPQSHQNKKGKGHPNGITPPVDGEKFEFVRTYCFRKSTLIKLNKLKANNPDFNIYISTIIDDAICSYYNSAMK